MQIKDLKDLLPKDEKVRYAIVGAVVLVLIVIIAAFSGNNNPAPSTNQSADAVPPPTLQNMKNLLSAGQSQKCLFTTDVNGSVYQGVIYVASGDLRGDFSTLTSKGVAIMSHLITDGTTAYIWTDSSKTGVKVAFSGIDAASAASENIVDPTKRLNYLCSGWGPDSSEFTPPSNITF